MAEVGLGEGRRSVASASIVVGVVSMAVYAGLRQLLVGPAGEVLVWVPVAVALAVPIVIGRRSVPDEAGMRGLPYGFAVACGLIGQYALVELAIRWGEVEGRVDSLVRAMGLISAPLVSSAVVWLRSEHTRATVLVALTSGALGALVLDTSAPTTNGFRLLVCAIAACLVGGVVTERATAVPEREMPAPHPGWIERA